MSESTVSLPKAFMREKNVANRKNLFRPRSVLIEGTVKLFNQNINLYNELILFYYYFTDDSLPSSMSTDGYFTQQHNDPKKFMEEHILVKIAPVPACQAIARKDYLWTYYKVE